MDSKDSWQRSQELGAMALRNSGTFVIFFHDVFFLELLLPFPFVSTMIHSKMHKRQRAVSLPLEASRRRERREI